MSHYIWNGSILRLIHDDQVDNIMVDLRDFIHTYSRLFTPNRVVAAVHWQAIPTETSHKMPH